MADSTDESKHEPLISAAKPAAEPPIGSAHKTVIPSAATPACWRQAATARWTATGWGMSAAIAIVTRSPGTT